MRPALALALPAVLLTAVASPAAAQVVTLRPWPGPSLEGGPGLVGERVVWSQSRCLGYCDPVYGGERGLYELLSAGPGGQVQRLFSARTSQTTGGAQSRSSGYWSLVSERILVVGRSVSGAGNGGEDEYGGVAIWAGPPRGERELLARCSALGASGFTPVALDGARLAYDPRPCDDQRQLVVRDFATGAVSELPVPAGGGNLRLRGRYAAWTDGYAETARVVVHDLAAGIEVSARVPHVQGIDLDADGTVAAVSGRVRRMCSTGRLYRWPAGEPVPVELGLPACASAGVRIEDGVIVFMGWEGRARSLRALSPDGAVRDLVRFKRVAAAGFDVTGERLVWAARDCAGGEAIFTRRMSSPPADMGSIDCGARFRTGVVTVRRGMATARLHCPRGCSGDLVLRHMGWRGFSLRPGETVVRVRLRRRVRRRLERRGALDAQAVLETYDRARGKHVRRRAVTLVAG